MATTYVCIICTPTVYTYVCTYMYNCIFTYVHTYVCMYVYMKVDLKDMNRESGVIAHFLAHRGDNLRLAALAFDPTYVGIQHCVHAISSIHIRF